MIELTAYPRFKRLITAHELHLFFAPTREETAWAAERMDSDGHQLALLLALKSYQRMGRFPKPDEYPEMVVDFVRRAVELPEGTLPLYGTGRTAERQRTEVRQRVGTKYQQSQARRIAEAAIRKETASKNRPADLINIALGKVVAAGLELPAFSAFDTMTSTIRTEVNTSICCGIHDRMSLAEQAGLIRPLEERDSDGTTQFNRLKQTAQGPSWSHFKRLFMHLEWLDKLGDTTVWVDGVASPKVTDFAGEADAADASELRDYAAVKRIALLACLAHTARMRVRDDLVTMLCKRVAMEVGLREEGEAEAFDAVSFRRQPEDKLRGAAAAADAAYPDNEGLVIDPETGIPSLKPHRYEGRRLSAKRLEQEVKARMPERTLMGIVARAAY
ncbi:DUF4158 domain-containing protein [Streptomyces sp. NPDC088251]|uniref:DUF4158 domain-containing protein n=1 Tax=unclassified Streptomyces TaxID=2593676 RepID=UPI00381590CF